MNRLLTIIALVSFFRIQAFASNEQIPVGARSAGLAHSSVTLNDQWSVFHNQAGLGRLTDLTVGFYYENRFLINSLSTGAMAIAAPVKNGAFGLSVYTFGLSGYHESRYGLSYGRKLGDWFCMGVQMNYLSYVFPESYGRTNTLTAEIGLQAKVSDKIILGAHIYNLNRAKISDNLKPEYISTVLRIGGQYIISEKVILATEFQKDIDHPIIYRAGTEYMPNEHLVLRMGIATNPGNYSFGFGYRIKSLALDIAASYHQVLGFTPQVGLSWKKTPDKPFIKYEW